MVWALLKNYYHEEEMLFLLKTWKAIAVRNEDYEKLIEDSRKLKEIQEVLKSKDTWCCTVSNR